MLALLPAPAGLAQHAWYFAAIFIGVVVGLILEPAPPAAVGLIGVTIVAVLAKWVLFSTAQLASPGFDMPSRSIEWALSGFSNSTVWLSFAAFMFSTGYQKTGLGRRIALLLVRALGGKTLTLGYAVMLADTILAPFTPSNTARSAGSIYPIIRNLPPLYDSHPHEPSARRIGGYLMWTALTTTSVTSSLFLTALAPNLLAIEFIRKATSLDISWMQWFLAAAPACVTLLLALPVLVYVLYPPEIAEGGQAPGWAARELEALGPVSRSELLLAALVLLAVFLWIFGGRHLSPTTTALAVVSLMLLCGVLSFDDVVSNHEAWKALDHDGDARDAGRWAQSHRLHPMVRRRRGRTHARSASNRDGPGAGNRLLLRPLPVRKHHRARDRHDAHNAVNRHRHSGFSVRRLCVAAGADTWIDGRAHAIRHDIRSGLPRQRLHHVNGVLAPRRHVRRHLPVRPACPERSIRAVEVIRRPGCT